MRFPLTFTRSKPAAAGVSAALGSDSAPPSAAFPTSTKPNANQKVDGGSCLLATRMKGNDGWPPHRIAVVCRYIGAAAPPNPINVQAFFYEESTGQWYTAAAAVSLQPASSADAQADTSGAAGGVAFFDCIVPVDYANVVASNMQSPNPGNGEFLIVATDPGGGAPASNGTYVFAASVDQTTAMS